MKPIVITASTSGELSQLVQNLGAAPFSGAGHLVAHRAPLGTQEIVLVETGIGKVNAASAATLILERLTPRLLVNTGCAGACAGSGLGLGDLAIASEECFPEEGVETPQGWRGLELIGIPVLEHGKGRLFNRLPLNGALALQALDWGRRHGFTAQLGPFHTVSACSGTAARGAELLQRLPGICENMEGGAVAQVALSYGTEFLEVRGISNFVEDRDLSRWDLRRAVTEVQRFLVGFLQESYGQT